LKGSNKRVKLPGLAGRATTGCVIMDECLDRDDEINVEGIAAEIAATFPFQDPTACREILHAMTTFVESGLQNRAERHQRSRIR
jgi:hypothetical protein